jgi:hypothetical protein
VEKLAEALKDSGMIKTTHLDSDKDQSDIYTTSSAAGDETQSVEVKELPAAIITVNGMWI